MYSAMQFVAGSTTSGVFDIQLAAIVKERILIEFCKLHNGFALALRTGDHLVFAGVTVA